MNAWISILSRFYDTMRFMIKLLKSAALSSKSKKDVDACVNGMGVFYVLFGRGSENGSHRTQWDLIFDSAILDCDGMEREEKIA